MARIDITVNQADIDELKLTSTQAMLKGTLVEYRSAAGCITVNTLIDAEGNSFNRRDLSQWSVEKLFAVPVIAALCASVKNAREVSVNFDVYYFGVNVVPYDRPNYQLPSDPRDKTHLVAVTQLFKGSNVFYRRTGAGGYALLSDLDVLGMIHNGGMDDLLVKVKIGNIEAYVPFMAFAMHVPSGSGEAYIQTVIEIFNSMLTNAFLQKGLCN